MNPIRAMLHSGSVLLVLAVCACAASAEKQVTAPAVKAGIVDYRCQADRDCAVKNVGNCCGYYPACVNTDSPTYPEQVRADCAREGKMAVCGFREISSCSCQQGRCEAITTPLTAVSDQGHLEKPSRAARVQGARGTGTSVYMQVHDDSEHRATPQAGRAAGFSSDPQEAQ